MKKQLLILVSAVLFSTGLSGIYFYHRGKAASIERILNITSAEYARLNHVNKKVEELLSSDAKGERLKNSLYLLRSIENANSALQSIDFLVDREKIDLSLITNELSLAAATVSDYIYRDSLGFDIQKTEEKLRIHANALELIKSSLTREDLRRMDEERLHAILSQLINSLPQ